MIYVALVICVAAIVCADLRWLRVAQREHYLPGTVSRFVPRWAWGSGALNRVLTVLVLLALIVAVVLPYAIVVSSLVLIVGPVGLSVRGRTSKLAWTRRLKTLAGLTGLVQFAAVGAAITASLEGAVFAAGLIAIVAPTIVDLSLASLLPWEKRKAEPFVKQAKARLQAVDPTVVAITGSYGKTTTKNYVAHLLSGSMTVMATPASFNNRAGLSRSINEQLVPGTDVFVAEMGTYGFGEIKELCDLCPPTISVLTSIGPVHLERFGSEAAIVQAKSEIFTAAEICILNVDDERLALKADELAEQGKTVWRCSATDTSADLCVIVTGDHADVLLSGNRIIEGVPITAPPTNVACAIAVALSLHVPTEVIAQRLTALPSVAHRQEVAVRSDGPTVIDDTYNANPASVRRALSLLARSAGEGRRRVVATPGMVELGRRQPMENFSFARDASEAATDLIVIGKTNRRALVDGAREGGLNVITVDHLPQAVEWVRNNMSVGDAVLYANDLPDHFP